MLATPANVPFGVQILARALPSADFHTSNIAEQYMDSSFKLCSLTKYFLCSLPNCQSSNKSERPSIHYNS